MLFFEFRDFKRIGYLLDTVKFLKLCCKNFWGNEKKSLKLG